MPILIYNIFRTMQAEECYFDAHNHLLDYTQEELMEEAKDAMTNRVLYCAPNATREAQYERMLKLAQQFPIGQQGLQIIPSFGLHPYFLQHEDNNPHWYESLRKVISLDDRFCIGEIGIDYRKEVLEINSKQKQQEFFIKQLQLSFQANRTVTVHCVRAHGELLKMLKRYNQLFGQEKAGISEQDKQLKKMYSGNPIIMHSFGGSREITAALLKLTRLNIYFSLCLKRSEELCTVIPLNKLILQTDAPYQNNLPLLKEQGLYDGEVSEETQKQQDKKNRIHYVRANIGSLCGYYQLDRNTFSRAIFENTLRAFRLLK